ncbi:MAG: hypothetical protein ACSHWQ_05950, partial [Spongiibacteraceae bacterium]
CMAYENLGSPVDVPENSFVSSFRFEQQSEALPQALPQGPLLLPTEYIDSEEGHSYTIQLTVFDSMENYQMLKNTSFDFIAEFDCTALVEVGKYAGCATGDDATPKPWLVVPADTDDGGHATVSFTEKDLRDAGVFPAGGGSALPLTALHFMLSNSDDTSHYNVLQQALLELGEGSGQAELIAAADQMEEGYDENLRASFTPVFAVSPKVPTTPAPPEGESPSGFVASFVFAQNESQNPLSQAPLLVAGEDSDGNKAYAFDLQVFDAAKDYTALESGSFTFIAQLDCGVLSNPNNPIPQCVGTPAEIAKSFTLTSDTARVWITADELKEAGVFPGYGEDDNAMTLPISALHLMVSGADSQGDGDTSHYNSLQQLLLIANQPSLADQLEEGRKEDSSGFLRASFTPVLVRDESTSADQPQPSPTGIVASFEFGSSDNPTLQAPVLSAQENTETQEREYQFALTVYDAASNYTSVADGTPLDFILQFDCGALTPIATSGLPCPEGDDQIGEPWLVKRFTTDADGQATVKVSEAELIEAGVFPVSELPLTALHLMVSGLGDTSHYNSLQQLVVNGSPEYADQMEEGGISFTPVLVLAEPANDDQSQPTDLTDGWVVHINTIGGEPLVPSETSDANGNYEHALQWSPNVDDDYEFWVYATDVAGCDSDRCTDNKVDFTEATIGRKFAIYTAQPAGSPNENTSSWRDSLQSLWECSGSGCDQYINGGRLSVPASEVASSVPELGSYQGPVVFWAFVDVEAGDSTEFNNPSSGFYSVLVNGLEGRAESDYFAYHATPVILSSNSESENPSPEELVEELFTGAADQFCPVWDEVVASYNSSDETDPSLAANGYDCDRLEQSLLAAPSGDAYVQIDLPFTDGDGNASVCAHLNDGLVTRDDDCSGERVARIDLDPSVGPASCSAVDGGETCIEDLLEQCRDTLGEYANRCDMPTAESDGFTARIGFSGGEFSSPDAPATIVTTDESGDLLVKVRAYQRGDSGDYQPETDGQIFLKVERFDQELMEPTAVVPKRGHESLSGEEYTFRVSAEELGLTEGVPAAFDFFVVEWDDDSDSTNDRSSHHFAPKEAVLFGGASAAAIADGMDDADPFVASGFRAITPVIVVN